MDTTEDDTAEEDTTEEDTGPQCTGDEELCGDTCIDTTSSVEHCGSCNSPCPDLPNATASCESSSCTYVCEAGFSDVNDDLSDPANSDGCEANCTVTNNGEEACDAVDNDCDGQVDEDFSDKGDDCTVGQGICERTGSYVCTSDGSGTECSATAGTPDSEETCDGADNDCDGEVDNGCDDDGDGYCDESMTIQGTPAVCSQGTDDCDDDEADVYPGAPGLCDGLDNDCNGETDEIRGVPGSGSTYSTSRSNEESEPFPSQMLAAPAGDGFCVYMQESTSSGYRQFAYMENGQPINSGSGASSTATPPPQVIAMAGDDERCAALTVRGSRLNIAVYQHSSGNQFDWGGETITTDYYQVDTSSRISYYNASLKKVEYNGTEYWAVGYVESTNNGARNRLALVENAVEDSGSVAQTETFNTFTNTGFADLGMPPTVGDSPNANDDFATVWFDTDAIRFQLTPSSNFNAQNQLSTANFGAEVPQLETLHGVTFYGFIRDAVDNYQMRTLANNYTVDASGTIELGNVSEQTRKYYVRDSLTEGPDGTTFYLDSHNDELVLMEVSGTDINNGGTYTHPDWQSDDHIVSAERRGDILEVLRLTNDDPYEFSIDEFTCY